MTGRQSRRADAEADTGSLSALGALGDRVLDAVVTMSADGRITGWNAHAQRLFGWSADEVIGRLMAETIIPERYREAHTRGLKRYLATGAGAVLDARTEISALRRDGGELPAELFVTALTDGDGVTFAGYIRDLSAQRAMESALRSTEARFQSVLENLPAIAYINAIGGASRYVSPKVQEMLGYAPEEWVARPDLWSRMLHPDDRERAIANLREGEAGGGSFTSVYRLATRDGRVIWIRDQATVLRDESGELSVHGVMFDISRERGAEAELELAVTERAEISEAMRRLPTGRPAEETAATISHELLRLPHLDMAVVYEFAHDGSVIPLGMVMPPGVPISVGRPVPAERAAYLRESATGPWIDEWRPQPDDDVYRRAWLEAGLTCAAYVPFGAEGTVHGLLAAATTSPIGSAGVSRWLPSMTEFAAIAAALLVPELGVRREQAGTRAAVAQILAQRTFTPVFQPIVRLGDGSVVGYEALTRFADGTPPDRQFTIAEAVGMGPKLERATMIEALAAAAQLPAGAWLSINLSPARLTDSEMPDLLAAAYGRPLVVEITERLAIEDYEAVRAALDRMAAVVEVAVDDAGAGFASLRHIIELRPRYVKLDIALVRGVDSDPARQALIAGMVYFARQIGCLLVGEGVETDGEREALRRLGVPFGQGYFFAHPAPADVVARSAPRASPVVAPAASRVRQPRRAPG